MSRKGIASAVTVALVLWLTLIGVTNAQTIWQQMDNVVVKSLYDLGALQIDGATTINCAVTNNGTLNQVGNASFAGTVAANGSRLAVAKYLSAAPQGEITVTNGGVITPTGTLQLLTAAGAVGASLGTGSSGDVVSFINTANQTITISDTTGTMLSANAALGQWDTLTVVYYGTSWIELARSNN